MSETLEQEAICPYFKTSCKRNECAAFGYSTWGDDMKDEYIHCKLIGLKQPFKVIIRRDLIS